MTWIIRTSVVLGALVALQAPETPRDRVARCWDAVHSAAAGETPSCLLEAAAALAPTVLAPRLAELDERQRARFHEALAYAMRRAIESYVPDALEPVAPDTDDADSGRVDLRYALGGRELTIRFAKERFVDVFWDGSSARIHYRRQCQTLLNGYSFAHLIGELEDRGVVVLEDFEGHPLDELPAGWKWRGFEQEDEKPYRVREESGNRFLRAEDRGENVMLYKEVRWDSGAYPFVSWRWRIRAVPEGADARYEASADSAAGIYLTYRRRLGLVPEAVKFVWSGHLSEGVAFRRPGIGMPWTVVAGSGAADERQWRRVVYHVSDVYRETFGGEPGGRPLGIGVLSDANSTGSYAAADYDDFVVLKDASDVSRVDEILELEN